MKIVKKNKIEEILFTLKLSSKKSIHKFFEKVRDRNDIFVLKCKNTGVLFLSRTNHIGITNYEKKKKFRYFGNNSRKQALKETSEDTLRRKKFFKNNIKKKKWLDIGTGSGGILDALKNISSKCHSVEPNKIMRGKLKQAGYKVFKSSKEANKNYYDVITMFHVFEHLTDPIKELKDVKKLLKKNGVLIIEVPHANDFLIKSLNLKEFKNFTFWSEHLILHVKKSLNCFIKSAGFKIMKNVNVQRYSFINHLYWILKKKPKGHIEWKLFRFKFLEIIYEKFLSLINRTDTLVVYATKNN
jgi:2-polyprenyl-3-methyl-5-hydroxy-6-metoxy-1,4-benzoquinol methylase|tara:strand:+ start:5720 stop:6616 length:897 start_codon:yes stop_codon:yes gene_type:complete